MAYTEAVTSNGRLRGSIAKSVDGINFHAFKGIPYAKPPVGELRFQDPVVLGKWSGMRDALKCGPIGAQCDFITKVLGGSDDCLYLNVYTKSIEPIARQPVMVFIHGGGFYSGSGSDTSYGPDYFMKKDVVLVTINYRLGVLGFLNLQDEIAPGNQGLKDQVMALRWVRDNIANFGGDPENVTIFGESAGGASVHYLTVSPLARGLFHKAISQSGVMLCPWASVPGDPKLGVYKLCELLGKKTKDPKEIVQFLKTINAMKLIEAQEKVMSEELNKRCNNIFGPGVDDKSKNPFLPMPLKEAVKQGAHVPYMLGHTAREGTLVFELFGAEYDFEFRDNNFESFVHPNFIETLKDYNLTVNDLRKMYFKSDKITKDKYDQFTDMIGDTLLVYALQKVIKNQVERNSAPTYMYQFTYDSGRTFLKSIFDSNIPGASHMDDLLYQFSMKFNDTLNLKPFKKGTQEYKVMEQMIELWTNFAKYGRPTPTVSELIPVYWPPVVNGTVLRYLNIGEELEMEKTLNFEERFFYKKNVSSKLLTERL